MNLALSFNGGKESLVILHQYIKICKIIFNVENENDFPEIIKYVKYITKLWNIKLLSFKNMKESITILKEKYQINIVILGCRKTDPHCEKLPIISPTDRDWPFILRFNPLLDWTYIDVWDYIEQFKLPVCSLYEKGFTSIGDKTNSFPNYHLFKEKFLHAKYLQNISTEREGRIKTKLPFTFIGKVIRGKGRGKQLGFPTANMNSLIAIDEGVYYGTCILKNEEYKIVMSVGTNLHFCDDNIINIEVHLLHIFPTDFYNEELKVTIQGYIRKMMKFSDINSLISAIHTDIKLSRYFYS